MSLQRMPSMIQETRPGCSQALLSVLLPSGGAAACSGSCAWTTATAALEALGERAQGLEAPQAGQTAHPRTLGVAVHATTIPRQALDRPLPLPLLPAVCRPAGLQQSLSMAALKPAQLAFEEACLRERLKFVRQLKGELQEEEGGAAQTVQAYTSLIDGAGWAAAVWSALRFRCCCSLRAFPN